MDGLSSRAITLLSVPNGEERRKSSSRLMVPAELLANIATEQGVGLSGYGVVAIRISPEVGSMERHLEKAWGPTRSRLRGDSHDCS